ncbi:MAG TPA: VWA domain-containing protein [Pyrinomonadaceae bacterium]|nr:VWA domain-containing protein [Pyrinomonadaceae bacterium]
MKKLIAVLVCFGVFGGAVSAQSGRTARPRIVPSPTPNARQNDSSTQNNANRPPELKGGITGSKTQTPIVSNNDETGEDDGEVIRVETNLVTIPVSVLDRSGRFVSGLRKQDFKIFENGIEQQIDSFASVEQPFTVVLLIDVSPSTAYRIEEIQDAAITFVNQLRRDDKVIVISFDERVRVLSRPTSDRNALRYAIQQARFGDGTSLYEAVDNAVNRQLRQIEGRKAVVLFTDGVDTTSRRASYQSTIRGTQETDVLFYPIRYDTYQGGGFGGNYPSPGNRRSSGSVLGDILGGILGGGNVQIGGNSRGGTTSAGGSRSEYETGRRYLNELALNSGGRIFEANRNNNLDAAFSGIAEELRRQYSIGYYPETTGRNGDRKQVKVRVMRPNLAVRAKGSYVVGEMNKKLAGK